MVKKIERSRIEAGRYELPSKLSFLMSEKLDFLSVTDRDGQWSVEMPAAAVSKLARARTDLKTNKAAQKKVDAQHATDLQAEQMAHGETRKELDKLQRRLKALERKLDQHAGNMLPSRKSTEAKAGFSGALAAKPAAKSKQGRATKAAAV